MNATRISRAHFLLTVILFAAAGVHAQEANSGLDLAATLSGESIYSQQLTAAPRSAADPAAAAFRVILYPTWKLSQHWAFNGAVEAYSLPYFFEDFSSHERGVEVELLQANVSYSRFWNQRSLVVRAGQMTSAFGSFLLRYDDASNPLIDVPMSYGYYLKGVTTKGLAGAEVDATVGKFDLRLQFTNSSPANPRSLFASDQYGDWTWGGGYTIVQGLRLGASAYRGPYLDRQYPFYFPGEGPPSQLPATGIGVDVEFARGPLNVYGEWQRFQMDYRAIPTFIMQAGYGEARFVLGPRWYAATRLGFSQPAAFSGSQSYEVALGFRPASRQIVKFAYERQQGVFAPNTANNVFAVQFVAALRPLSIATGR